MRKAHHGDDVTCARERYSAGGLGRSLQDLLSFLGDLQSKKIDLYVHQQALDTSTPSGKAMFGMLGVFAEFERTIIIDGAIVLRNSFAKESPAVRALFDALVALLTGEGRRQ